MTVPEFGGSVFGECHGDLVPRWLLVWPCLAGAEFFSSAPHTNLGETSWTLLRCSYWQSATRTLLGRETEASLK